MPWANRNEGYEISGPNSGAHGIGTPVASGSLTARPGFPQDFGLNVFVSVRHVALRCSLPQSSALAVYIIP